MGILPCRRQPTCGVRFIAKLEAEMREAARKFEFEKAAKLRDSIKELRDKEFLFG